MKNPLGPLLRVIRVVESPHKVAATIPGGGGG